MEDPKTAAVDRSVVDETLEDHRECMEVLRRLEDCLDRHPDVPGNWIAELLEELSRLENTLRCHFTEEQQGPLYRSIPVAKPRFADRLRKLESEHGSILEACREAIRRAGSLADPQKYEIRELNAQLQLLVATIRRHEAEENEIILEAHWDEIGVGD